MATSLPPQPDVSFETGDCDHAGEYLSGAYGSEIRLRSSGDGYRCRFSRAASDAFAVDVVGQDVRMTYAVEESLPVLGLIRPRGTVLGYRCGDVEHRVGSGEAILVSRAEHGPGYQIGWGDGDIEAVTMVFPLLDQVAAGAGNQRNTPIRFTDPLPGDPVAARQLGATLDYLTGALRDRPRSMNEPLVVGATGRLLAATFLSVFPNTADSDPTIEERHDAHPHTLRQAVAFIDDNAHRDISVADIATAAHVTIRAVQHAFRRHLDTTPMRYLRRARLEHAHRELLATEPTTGTVTDIAARWGFFHPGRFARYYRGVYGRTPQQSLLRDGR
ncbi:helix-turn-helix transcriptional regulator [Amycolatopsis samaneae]|uniref:Helix-turn-helix transcriptional regulator n=1 Tax=Amycolatopsis samaneae TaxID=664691 RepID=A0ABW5GRX4_9PSEU